MSRNHARRLDAREPQHLDPNWYTFRQVFTLGDGGTKVRVISGAFAPSQMGGHDAYCQSRSMSTSNSASSSDDAIDSRPH
jgi:hypothetical protein